MIKALNIKTLTTALSRPALLSPKMHLPRLSLQSRRLAYSFSSQDNRMPKNKEEAWMMQEQKSLKQNPL